MSKCPKCSNSIGFVFGMCTSCGWNYISNKWERIKVNPDRFPEEIRSYLIEQHASRYESK